MTRSPRTLALACQAGAFLLALLLPPSLGAQTLDKWAPGTGPLGGSLAAVNPDYEMGGNPAVKHGADGAGFIKSTAAVPKMPAVYEAHVAGGSYVGKRVRLTAYVRTEAVAGAFRMYAGIQSQKLLR